MKEKLLKWKNIKNQIKDILVKLHTKETFWWGFSWGWVEERDFFITFENFLKNIIKKNKAELKEKREQEKNGLNPNGINAVEIYNGFYLVMIFISSTLLFLI